MENNENKNEVFTYTYSARQQEEIKRIRQKYVPREENKIEMLRKLDRNAEKPGTIASLAVGTISSLILGTGMACIMEFEGFFVIGIILGVIGLAGALTAYPIYKIMLKKQREKIAPEILRLTDELRQEGK